jgi:SAF domain
MAVVSVALVAACSAIFALIYLNSSRLASVIGVSREVPQGQVVQASDLREVDVTLADGVEAVPVSDASEVIGKPASITLLPGTLLSPADIGATQALASGEAVVGVDLKPGMLPAGGVVQGEPVLVVLTGPSGSPVTDTSSGSSDVMTTATVVGVDDDPDDSGTGDIVVSVEVPSRVAPLVADSSAAGQAALVQVGGTP